MQWRRMHPGDATSKSNHYATIPLFRQQFDHVTLKLTVCFDSDTCRARVGYKVENATSFDSMLASESWVTPNVHDHDQLLELLHEGVRQALAFLHTFPTT